MFRIKNTCSLARICRDCGASKRTIERLFVAETQLTLGRWRQQARLLHAIRSIASGEKIISAALEAGYESPALSLPASRKYWAAHRAGISIRLKEQSKSGPGKSRDWKRFQGHD